MYFFLSAFFGLLCSPRCACFLIYSMTHFIETSNSNYLSSCELSFIFLLTSRAKVSERQPENYLNSGTRGVFIVMMLYLFINKYHYIKIIFIHFNSLFHMCLSLCV